MGDKWVGLVLTELAGGPRRYGELSRSIPARPEATELPCGPALSSRAGPDPARRQSENVTSPLSSE